LSHLAPTGALHCSVNFIPFGVLQINSLHVVNFKNHRDKYFDFSDKLNAIYGNNGTGKTNLLDAINYLCLTRSYFNPVDSQNIRENEKFFTLNGDFTRKEAHEKIFCGYSDSGKKILKKNNLPYEKISEHIGLLPLIMNAPSDSAIIMGGSNERRKFIDSTLSQTDPGYLTALIKFNKLLELRNAQLKYFEKNSTFDPNLLLSYDEQISPLNHLIFIKRKVFFESITTIFHQHYGSIAGKPEPVNLGYYSEFFNLEYLDISKRNYKRDMALGFTSSGIHKDEMELVFNDQPAKKWASQGQQKTILIALRMAQLQYMENILGIKPILLLDDIFDKLDPSRSKALIRLLGSDLTGQVITTHTNKEFFDIGNKILLD